MGGGSEKKEQVDGGLAAAFMDIARRLAAAGVWKENVTHVMADEVIGGGRGGGGDAGGGAEEERVDGARPQLGEGEEGRRLCS